MWGRSIKRKFSWSISKTLLLPIHINIRGSILLAHEHHIIFVWCLLLIGPVWETHGIGVCDSPITKISSVSAQHAIYLYFSPHLPLIIILPHDITVSWINTIMNFRPCMKAPNFRLQTNNYVPIEKELCIFKCDMHGPLAPYSTILNFINGKSVMYDLYFKLIPRLDNCVFF